MTAWAAEELKYADLGDRRRNKRLIRLVSDTKSGLTTPFIRKDNLLDMRSQKPDELKPC